MREHLTAHAPQETVHTHIAPYSTAQHCKHASTGGLTCCRSHAEGALPSGTRYGAPPPRCVTAVTHRRWSRGEPGRNRESVKSFLGNKSRCRASVGRTHRRAAAACGWRGAAPSSACLEGDGRPESIASSTATHSGHRHQAPPVVMAAVVVSLGGERGGERRQVRPQTS